MSDISVNLIVLLLKGIPEGLLATFALHAFTRTKVNFEKYLMLSAIYVVATYLIRFVAYNPRSKHCSVTVSFDIKFSVCI